MNIIDCKWEKKNLNRNTCEIVLSHNDVITTKQLAEIEAKYEYVVVKIPTKNILAFKEMAVSGYHFIESQLNLHFKAASLKMPSKLVNYYLPKVKIEKCNDEHTAYVLNRIKENLFTTDRIALDPNFGVEVANVRYANWINSTINEAGYELCNFYIGNINAGFCYFHKTPNTIHYILGALYPEYQGNGFGLVEPLVSCIYMKDNNYKTVDTSVSTNNLDVIKCYMECGFTIEGINNVFVKVK